MRYLIISVLILLSLNSCKPFQLDGQNSTWVQESLTNNYFADYTKETLYRGRIEVYGNTITGLFIAKRIGEHEHRMVFTSDFGNTLFDFTITDTSFHVNYVMEDLNKKIILNILKRDFTAMLKVVNPVDKRLDTGASWGFKSETDNKYFIVNKDDGQLSQIVLFSKYKRKVDLNFTTDENKELRQIEIIHHNINLKITLIN